MSAQSLLAEFEQELVATKNLLEVLPENRLNWQPHEKAMTLGQLAFHVAIIPFRYLNFAKDGQVEVDVIIDHPIPETKAQIMQSLEQSASNTQAILSEVSQPWFEQEWQLLKSGNAIAVMPRMAFIRAFVFNHWYHHRGELATYLRILDVKLPSIYGPTADVNPFA